MKSNDQNRKINKRINERKNQMKDGGKKKKILSKRKI